MYIINQKMLKDIATSSQEYVKEKCKKFIYRLLREGSPTIRKTIAGGFEIGRKWHEVNDTVTHFGAWEILHNSTALFLNF